MFDTLKYSKSLETAGVPRQQAEAHMQIMAEVIESNLATRQDIRELEHKLVELEYRLLLKLSSVMGAFITVGVALTVGLSKLL